MGLNAAKVVNTSNRKPIPLMEAGTYPARLAQVIDLGLHPDSYKGEEKPPKTRIMLTYEFVDEFLKDEDGQDMPDKPRWLSEEMWLFSLKADKATSTERYGTFDPAGAYGGDFAACLNVPVNVTVIQEAGKNKNAGKTFNKIAGVSAMRQKDAERCPKMVNSPKFFSLDDPDIEVFMSLPRYVQDRIKSNLEFKDSLLEKALAGVKDSGPSKSKSEPDKEDSDNMEEPY